MSLVRGKDWVPSGIHLVNSREIHEDEHGKYGPSVVCQLRLDAPNKTLADVLALDKRGLATLPGYKLHADRALPNGGHELELECKVDGRMLRQLMRFFTHDGHVYTSVATYVAGAPFEKLRAELDRALVDVQAAITGGSAR